MVSLKEVIAQAREKGFSRREIESELFGKGYSKSEINSAFGTGVKTKKEKAGTKLPVFEKFKLLFTNPQGFFENVREKSIGPSLTLFVIIGVIMAAIMFVFISIITRIFNAGGGMFSFIFGFYGFVLFALGIVGTFIYSGISHLVVKGLHGEQGYTQTYNAVTYSLIPYLLLSAVPYVGFLSIIYSIVLMIFGLSEYHNISKGKAALAALVPVIIVIVIIVIFFIVLFTSLRGIY